MTSALSSLRRQSKRPFVQSLLDSQISALQTRPKAAQSSSSKGPVAAARSVKKVTTFAYDESDKFVKLYYTLEGVQSLPADAIKTEFAEDSFRVLLSDWKGYDWELSAKGLSHAADPSKSVVKQKTDSLLVMLKKAKEGQNWGNLLKIDAAAASPAAAVPDLGGAGDDPQAGLMQMMKKMYDDGDDEMKRTIKKAMFESQQKRGEFDA